MFVVDFSGNTIRYLFFKKTMLGKYEIDSCGVVDRSEGDWEEQLYQILKNQKVALILPDNISRIIRFEAPEGISQQTIQEKVEKEIASGRSIDNFAYDCGIKKDQAGNSEIMCLATENKDLVSIFTLIQEYDAKPTLAIPESLAVFRILRDGIIEGEIVLLLDIEPDTTTFIFYDATGPIFKYAEETNLTKLDTSTLSAIENFKQETQREINRVVLYGSESAKIDPFEFRKTINFLTIKAEDVLRDRITKLGIKFDSGTENTGSYLAALAGGMLTQEPSTLNLVKNDVLMNVEKEAMKHTSEKEESAEKITEKSEAEAEIKINKRPQLMTEDVAEEPEEVIEEKFETKKEYITEKPEVESKPEPTIEPEIEERKAPMSHTIGSPDSQFRSSFRADESKSSSGAKKKIILFIIVAVLVAILAGVILFMLGGSATAPKDEPTPPTETAPTPTPTPELDRADLTLEVLNGSGEGGVAGEVASALEDLGYASPISTGNADAYDYEETVIQLQEEFADFFDMLKEDLENEGYVVADEYEELDANATTDGVVIVGSLNENQSDEDVTPTPTEDEDEETTPTPTPEDE